MTTRVDYQSGTLLSMTQPGLWGLDKDATAKLLNSRGIKARHGIWWHATVRDIIKREAPTLAPVTEQQGRRARGKFIFAGVLQCPHCDGRLTGRRRAAHRTDYHCAHKKVDARHPHISIKEADMIGWMSERFAQLPMPTDVVAEEDVEAQRAELMRSRERIADNYVIGVYSREQRDERLVELQAKLEAIDQAGVPLNIGPIPWDAPPAQVNTTLRAFVRRVQFDAATHRPLEVQWAVPGWNVAGAGKAGHAATRQEARPASREHVPIAPIAEEGR